MSAQIIQWKVCPLFQDYEVSEYGDIRRCKPDKRGRVYGHLLSPKFQGGYKRYTLRRDGKSHNVHAYRMVAEAFLGLKPFNGAEVCHNDGVKLHNHYSNLRWDTHKSNHLDRIAHGSSNRGAKNGKAKLTADQIVYIRRRVASGAMQRELAEEFGVARPTISRLLIE
jgi:hypothetical protein